MDTSLETELVRFRIEGDLKSRAEEVCARYGLELNDVMRTLVRRIALDDSIPFDMNAPGRIAEPSGSPFDRYGAFLTEDLAHLKAKSVISLSGSYIANRARRMATERHKARPNRAHVARWKSEVQEALQYRRTLDTKDQKLVAKGEKNFAALLTSDG